MVKVETQEIIKEHEQIELKQVSHGEQVRNFVYGFNDGIITTLAIVAALSGATVSNLIIIFAGVANILADGISMSLGGYISVKSQVEVYQKEKAREIREIETVPEVEKEEIRQIYRQKGFKGKDLEKIVKIITADKKRWLDVMMKEELGLVESNFPNPVEVGAIIFVAFLIGGVIPILPYIFLNGKTALITAVSLSFISIFLLGSMKSRFTQKNWLISGVEMLVIGMLATAVAYFIGGAINYFV